MPANVLPSVLTAEQVEEFFEQGFTIVRQVFVADEVAEMQAAFDRLQQTAETLTEAQVYNDSYFSLTRLANGTNALRLIMWCGANEPVLADYGQDVRLVKMAAQLLGSSEMQQLINQAHYKLPGQEVKFDWHQDSQNRMSSNPDDWRDLNGKGSYVQILTALDEMTEENGPVLFVPGSYRIGHLDLASRFDNLPFDPQTAVPATMQPGDVVLFGPYTIHGSMPNRSSVPRRVFINGFAYPRASRKVYKAGGTGRLVRLAAND